MSFSKPQCASMPIFFSRKLSSSSRPASGSTPCTKKSRVWFSTTWVALSRALPELMEFCACTASRARFSMPRCASKSSSGSGAEYSCGAGGGAPSLLAMSAFTSSLSLATPSSMSCSSAGIWSTDRGRPAMALLADESRSISSLPPYRCSRVAHMRSSCMRGGRFSIWRHSVSTLLFQNMLSDRYEALQSSRFCSLRLPFMQ
mmetsp:Transcript_2588/g.6015  ORF Transcript_2588/g.6015 Transcript_2588/m.6015 type:complete len:202 (+) Transcript_2588:1344-1949(+)